MAHRAVICAALSHGKCRISPIDLSDDITATIEAVKALGAKARFKNNVLYIDGANMFGTEKAEINCRESGSTLRFLIPVAAAAGITCTFGGTGRLPQRPIGTYLELLPKSGVRCESSSGLPLTVGGKLKAGKFSLRGDISSQFISGLLFALPILDGDSEIELTTELQSAGYVNMTVGSE